SIYLYYREQLHLRFDKLLIRATECYSGEFDDSDDDDSIGAGDMSVEGLKLGGHSQKRVLAYNTDNSSNDSTSSKEASDDEDGDFRLAASVQRVLGVKPELGVEEPYQYGAYTLEDVSELLRLGDKLYFNSAEFEVLVEYEANALELQATINSVIDDAHRVINRMNKLFASNSYEYAESMDVYMSRIQDTERALNTNGLHFPMADKLRKLRDVPKWCEKHNAVLKDKKLTHELLDEVLAEAEQLEVSIKVDLHAQLLKLKADADEWATTAEALIDGRQQFDLRDVGKLLEKGRNMLFSPAHYAEVGDLQRKALTLQSRTDRLADCTESTELVQRPRYAEAVELVKACRDFGRFEPSSLGKLRTEISRVDAWAAEIEHMFSPVAKQQGVAVDEVLALVQAHLRRATQIAESKQPPTDLYCVCLQPEGGLMVECEQCSEWYHAKCVGLKTADVSDCQFFCPLCSAGAKGEQPRLLADYPHLSHIDRAVTSCRTLGLVAADLDPLVTILLDAQSLTQAIKGILQGKKIVAVDEVMEPKKALLVKIVRALLMSLLGLGINLRHGIFDDLWTELQELVPKNHAIAMVDVSRDVSADAPVTVSGAVPVDVSADAPETGPVETKVQALQPSESRVNVVESMPSPAPLPAEEMPAQQIPVKVEVDKVAHPTPDTDADAVYIENGELMGEEEEMRSQVSIPGHMKDQLENLVHLILNPPAGEIELGQGLVSAGDAFGRDSENCVCNVHGTELSEDIVNPGDPKCASAPVIQCDNCQEYFHIKCAQVPAPAARLIFLHQMQRSLNADVDVDMELPDGPTDYVCPNCCFVSETMYPYGELFFE
ncbi:hypothetical protein GGF37_003273, partial [Kickxella alabastrina]